MVLETCRGRCKERRLETTVRDHQLVLLTSVITWVWWSCRHVLYVESIGYFTVCQQWLCVNETSISPLLLQTDCFPVWWYRPLEHSSTFPSVVWESERERDSNKTGYDSSCLNNQVIWSLFEWLLAEATYEPRMRTWDWRLFTWLSLLWRNCGREKFTVTFLRKWVCVARGTVLT